MSAVYFRAHVHQWISEMHDRGLCKGCDRSAATSHSPFGPTDPPNTFAHTYVLLNTGTDPTNKRAHNKSKYTITH